MQPKKTNVQHNGVERNETQCDISQFILKQVCQNDYILTTPEKILHIQVQIEWHYCTFSQE